MDILQNTLAVNMLHRHRLNLFCTPYSTSGRLSVSAPLVVLYSTAGGSYPCSRRIPSVPPQILSLPRLLDKGPDVSWTRRNGGCSGLSSMSASTKKSVPQHPEMRSGRFPNFPKPRLNRLILREDIFIYRLRSLTAVMALVFVFESTSALRAFPHRVLPPDVSFCVGEVICFSDPRDQFFVKLIRPADDDMMRPSARIWLRSDCDAV